MVYEWWIRKHGRHGILIGKVVVASMECRQKSPPLHAFALVYIVGLRANKSNNDFPELLSVRQYQDLQYDSWSLSAAMTHSGVWKDSRFLIQLYMSWMLRFCFIRFPWSKTWNNLYSTISTVYKILLRIGKDQSISANRFHPAIGIPNSLLEVRIWRLIGRSAYFTLPEKA